MLRNVWLHFQMFWIFKHWKHQFYSLAHPFPSSVYVNMSKGCCVHVGLSTTSSPLLLSLSLYATQRADSGRQRHRLQSHESTPAGEDAPPPSGPAPTGMLGRRPPEPEAQVGRKRQPHTCPARRRHGLHATDGGQEPQVGLASYCTCVFYCWWSWI